MSGYRSDQLKAAEVAELVRKWLVDLGHRLERGPAALDLGTVTESVEIAEQHLARARDSMAEFSGDTRTWDELTVDERQRIAERAIRRARGAEREAREAAGLEVYF